MWEFRELWFAALFRASMAICLSALVVAAILRGLRIRSCRWQAAAWWCVLCQGTLLVPIVLKVPRFVTPSTEQKPVAIESQPPDASFPQVDHEFSSPRESANNVASATDARDKIRREPTEANTLEPRASIEISSASLGATTETRTHLSAMTEPRPRDWNWKAALMGVWLAGIGVLSVGMLLAYWLMLRQSRRWQAASDEWRQPWQLLLKDAGIKREIPLVVSDRFGPALVRRVRGYVVVVPDPIWRDLSEAERAAILRHELAHLNRRDPWRSLGARLLALPHWFNPFAWWSVRKLEERAEWMCDQFAQAEDPHSQTYARALMKLGDQHRSPSWSAAANGGRLYHRIKRLISPPLEGDTHVKRSTLLVVLALLLMGNVLRFQLVAQETEAVDAPPGQSSARQQEEPSRPVPDKSTNPAAELTEDVEAVVSLKVIDAKSAALVVKKLFADQKDLIITAEPRSNQIRISGPIPSIDQAVKLLQQLDQPAPKQRQPLPTAPQLADKKPPQQPMEPIIPNASKGYSSLKSLSMQQAWNSVGSDLAGYVDLAQQVAELNQLIESSEAKLDHLERLASKGFLSQSELLKQQSQAKVAEARLQLLIEILKLTVDGTQRELKTLSDLMKLSDNRFKSGTGTVTEQLQVRRQLEQTELRLRILSRILESAKPLAEPPGKKTSQVPMKIHVTNLEWKAALEILAKSLNLELKTSSLPPGTVTIGPSTLDEALDLITTRLEQEGHSLRCTETTLEVTRKQAR